MEKPSTSPSPSSRLIPVSKWPEFHPWPPPGGLRHLIFHARENGFSAAVVRIGRRVLIDEAAFFTWAKAHGKGKATTGTPPDAATSPAVPIAAAPESPQAAPRT
jgi:hypothetical protein